MTIECFQWHILAAWYAPENTPHYIWQCFHIVLEVYAYQYISIADFLANHFNTRLLSVDQSVVTMATTYLQMSNQSYHMTPKYIHTWAATRKKTCMQNCKVSMLHCRGSFSSCLPHCQWGRLQGGTVGRRSAGSCAGWQQWGYQSGQWHGNTRPTPQWSLHGSVAPLDPLIGQKISHSLQQQKDTLH